MTHRRRIITFSLAAHVDDRRSGARREPSPVAKGRANANRCIDVDVFDLTGHFYQPYDKLIDQSTHVANRGTHSHGCFIGKDVDARLFQRRKCADRLPYPLGERYRWASTFNDFPIASMKNSSVSVLVSRCSSHVRPLIQVRSVAEFCKIHSKRPTANTHSAK